MSRAALLRLGLLVAGLVAAGLLLRWVGAAPGTAWVDTWIRGPGPWGEVVFVAVGAGLTAVGTPRQAVAFAGGYAFGTALGGALALLGQLLGAAVAYGWARAIGREWAARRLEGRFGQRVRPLVAALVEAPFGATLALRLLPIGSNIGLNLLAGLAALRPLPFLAASAIGYLPQTIVFALLGKGVRVDGAWQLALAAGLLVGSVLLGLRLVRRHRAGRALEGAAPPVSAAGTRSPPTAAPPVG